LTPWNSIARKHEGQLGLSRWTTNRKGLGVSPGILRFRFVSKLLKVEPYVQTMDYGLVSGWYSTHLSTLHIDNFDCWNRTVDLSALPPTKMIWNLNLLLDSSVINQVLIEHPHHPFQIPHDFPPRCRRSYRDNLPGCLKNLLNKHNWKNWQKAS